jgi:hypothetical protein
VPFAKGNLVTQLLNGFLELLEALLLGIQDRQQRLDERGPFGIRNGRELELHAFHGRKPKSDQLRQVSGFLRSYLV